PFPFLQIVAADIRSLVDNKVKEGDRLEYKENLPKANDDERIKFLSMVASPLANSLGGDTHAARSPAVPALCREPRPVARAGRVLRPGQPEARARGNSKVARGLRRPCGTLLELQACCAPARK
ncbi:MAG: hypothetical protein WA746_02745, partial [Isosphaeraceae bacterium]